MDTSASPEVIEEGIKIVEQLLAEWSRNGSEQDGEDVVMLDMEAETSADAQLAELKQCVEKYRAQIEGNPWLQSVLTTL